MHILCAQERLNDNRLSEIVLAGNPDHELSSDVPLWKIDDFLTGNASLILSSNSKAFDHIEFTPDGGRLLGSGAEQLILLWHAHFDEALKLACEVVSRNLTPTKRTQSGFTEYYHVTYPQWPIEP